MRPLRAPSQHSWRSAEAHLSTPRYIDAHTHTGLSVHMNQVHKENLTHVENAIPGRQGLEIEIFGMEGVPEDIVDQHNQQVTQKHFAEEAERQRLTGNPARGALANGDMALNKRERVHETLDEIAERAEKYRQDRINGVLPPPAAEAPKAVSLRLLEEARFMANQFGQTPPAAQPFAAPPFPIDQNFPPIPAAFPPGHALPPAYPPIRPGSIPGDPGLPQRPGFGSPPTALPQDAIDDLIRDVAEPAAEKKSKKDKNIKLVFYDENVSPEEKMALLSRYADFMRT